MDAANFRHPFDSSTVRFLVFSFFQTPDIAFSGVIVWALVAIAVRQASQFSIVASMIGFAIVLGLLMLFTQVRASRKDARKTMAGIEPYIYVNSTESFAAVVNPSSPPKFRTNEGL
jgi:multisubunit Na+/H+ antiporter MnhB subunit